MNQNNAKVYIMFSRSALVLTLLRTLPQVISLTTPDVTQITLDVGHDNIINIQCRV